jgi:hypothetical protein
MLYPVWLAEWSRKPHPAPRRCAAAMTVCPGTGLLSQMIERGRWLAYTARASVHWAVACAIRLTLTCSILCRIRAGVRRTGSSRQPTVELSDTERYCSAQILRSLATSPRQHGYGDLLDPLTV